MVTPLLEGYKVLHKLQFSITLFKAYAQVTVSDCSFRGLCTNYRFRLLFCKSVTLISLSIASIASRKAEVSHKL